MPAVDRRQLGFAEAAKETFSFLREHGFRCARSEPTFVQFEAGHVYVNVYHGRHTYEIGLEIGPLPIRRQETPFPLQLIIRLIEGDDAVEYRNFAANSVDGVMEGVVRLAMVFRRYVEAGLLRAPDLFDRLRAHRAAWAEERATDVKLKRAQHNLEAAWQCQDYEAVVTMLAPLRIALTPADRIRLELAEKYIAEN